MVSGRLFSAPTTFFAFSSSFSVLALLLFLSHSALSSSLSTSPDQPSTQTTRSLARDLGAAAHDRGSFHIYPTRWHGLRTVLALCFSKKFTKWGTPHKKNSKQKTILKYLGLSMSFLLSFSLFSFLFSRLSFLFLFCLSSAVFFARWPSFAT